MTKKSPYFTRGALIALITAAFDQAHKEYMLFGITDFGKEPIHVTSFFNLVLVWNHGVSFGMMRDLGHSAAILSVFSLTIISILLLWLKKTDKKIEAISLGLICGGALGNVIDRVRYGAVADFFDFHVAGYHWPAFNVADSAVCIGALTLCYVNLFTGSKATESPDQKSPNQKSESKSLKGEKNHEPLPD